MIKNSKPISIVEAQEYILGDSEMENELKGFIHKFSGLKIEDAKKLREELEKLDLIKMKEEHIAKIIDLLPETKEDLNKIFIDVGLDEDEANKIIDKVKEFK